MAEEQHYLTRRELRARERAAAEAAENQQAKTASDSKESPSQPSAAAASRPNDVAAASHHSHAVPDQATAVPDQATDQHEPAAAHPAPEPAKVASQQTRRQRSKIDTAPTPLLAPPTRTVAAAVTDTIPSSKSKREAASSSGSAFIKPAESATKHPTKRNASELGEKDRAARTAGAQATRTAGAQATKGTTPAPGSNIESKTAADAVSLPAGKALLGEEFARVAAPPTASMLILPQIPEADLTRPLNETGEVVLTGTITLPSSTSNTGRVPNVFDTDQGTPKEDSASLIPVHEEAQPIRAFDSVNRYSGESVLPTSRRSHISAGGLTLAIISGIMLIAACGILIYTILRG